VTAGDRATPLATAGMEAALRLTGSAGRSAGLVGVGIDAVDLERFARVLERRTSMAGRLFTAGELAYARAARDPIPRLSTRFAAKEAVMKALGVGLGAFPFHDVEVVRVGLDAPWLVLRGPAEALALRSGVGRWHLSLTHTHQVAMALVVAETGPAAGAQTGPGDSAGATRTPMSADPPPTP
jgi:holo-[acyl-carrier protein] synthase